MSRYVIITPCFNEERYIHYPLASVAQQTLKPTLWVIVDDGSTDSTAAIIRQHTSSEPLVRYHYRFRPKDAAYFASNVHAIMEGVALAHADSRFNTSGEHPAIDYIAILDADISLPSDYYESIIARLDADPKLGIASGVYENMIEGRLVPVLNDRRSTPKALMVFRRECFEQIGGLLPLSCGGEDTAACVLARMHGWKVWSFRDIKTIHHRPTGMGNAASTLRVRWNQGRCEYLMGTHPLFFVLKCLRRCILERPYIVGGILRLIGYLYPALRREPRVLSEDIIAFTRKEQLGRLLRLNRVRY